VLDFQVLSMLLERYRGELGKPVRAFHVGERFFDFNRSRYLVGVINLSTDSSYRESVCSTTEEAIARADMLHENGADIIDIGSESTHPKARRVDIENQLRQLLPVVESLKERGMLVSVESYYPEVFEACAKAGADVFNLTGTLYEDEIFRIAMQYDIAVILCYIQGVTVRHVSDFRFQDDIIAEMMKYFRNLTTKTEKIGLTKCFIDPGLGFCHNAIQDKFYLIKYQMHTILSCFRLHELGYPVFNIAPSASELLIESDYHIGELFFSILAFLCGTHAIRLHEVGAVNRIREIMGIYDS